MWRNPGLVASSALALAAAWLGAGASARAQSTRVQATVAAQAGATDNAASVEVGTADVFAGLQPTFSLVTEGPRLVSDLSLLGDLRQYASVTDASTRSLRARWLLSWYAAPTVRVIGDLGTSYGKLAAYLPSGAVGAVPAGAATYLDVSGGATILKDFSATWRGSDLFLVTGYFPQDDPPLQSKSITVHNVADAQLSWKRDAGTLGLTTDYHHYIAAPNTTIYSENDVFVALRAEWLHELSTFWGVIVGGGAGFDVSDAATAATPIGNAALTYRREQSDFELRVSENVAANTQLATTLLTSDVTLSANLRPLDTLALRAVGGISRGTDIAGDDGEVWAYRFDTTLTWMLRENLSIELSYSALHQTNSSTVIPAVPLTRNQGMIGVRFYLPDNRPTQPIFATPNLRVRQSEEWDASESEHRR